MLHEKLISIFPYNGGQYLKNIAFDPKRNKGIEATIFAALKENLNRRNIEIATYDATGHKKPFKFVYFDMPYPWDFKAWKVVIKNRKKNILICNESSLIIPFNYWKILHFFFAKVYTWYEPFIDNKKYRRILLPKSSYGIDTKPKRFKDKKFLVIVNKNVGPFLPFKIIKSFGKELYSERLKSIDFFEKKIPERFSLYGRGWNKPKKHSLSERLLGFRKYKTYKGEVDNKIELISNYKFSICFENLTDVNGYITEKIFDCLKAKCVPVYWGATDIEKYIPKNCFIDFRDFKNYSELLKFLDSVTEKEYNKYIENIEVLLSDKKFVNTWFEDQFASFFYKEVLEMNNDKK